MNKNILFAGVLALLSTSTALAQSADKNKVLLGAQKVDVNYTDTVIYVPVLTNQDLELTASADWVTASLEHNRLKINIKKNNNPESREASLTVAAKNGSMTRTLTLEQDKEGSAIYAPTDDYIAVASATASASQSGEGIEKTYDRNTSTLWHSPYNNNNGGGFPFTLTYNFENVDQIDYLRYVPRSSGGSNGNFDDVEIYVKCEGDADFRKVYTGSWGGSSVARDVTFDEPLQKPVAIQFVIKSGANNFASCAEMEFYKKKTNDPDTKVFANDLWDSLVEGTTQKDIDAISNPFTKFVAQQLLDNKEEFTKDRVQEYICRLSPYTQSDLLNSPGKYYDKLQGVTGINISKGHQAIAVSGLPSGESLPLKVVSWFSQELNDKGVGGGPVEYTYTLHNGINNIEYTSDYDGLAYIAYYSDEYPIDREKYPNVKVHFINGSVNGYLSPDRTNEELDEVLKNAKNRCIDLVGNKVHSIWQVSGMRDYCKASDGTSKGYVQFMNVLDTLVTWEQHLLGLQKYDRVPDNRTMAYVNYTYYMFQGDYGVSFMYGEEDRVLNCKTIMYGDGDAIWGLSHEWGHQHQMQPYFCWAGLGESSNNMNSCENVLRMGYTGDWHAKRIKDNWTGAYDHFFKGVTTTNLYNGAPVISYQYVGPGRGNYTKNNDTYTLVDQGQGDYVYEEEKVGPGGVATKRNEAYRNIDFFSWSPAIQEAIRKQFEKGSRIPEASDTENTLSTSEVYVEENTAPFYMLHNYFSYTLPKEGDNSLSEFQLDLYEALRQTDNEKGSTIEPGKTDVDKYELLASAQNGNKNGKYAQFVADYPNSCWVKNKYIRQGAGWTENSVPFIFNYIRKASKICGYNLFDYFDKFGFMRTAVMLIDDYGNKGYAMTEDMKAEFKADMEALNLKKVDDKMMEKIAHSDLPVYETPDVPNAPVVK